MSSKFSNAAKSTLCSLAAGVASIPYASLIPFMPLLIIGADFGWSGFILQAFIHFGSIMSRFITIRFVLKFGSRVAVILGILLQLSFLMYLTQALSDDAMDLRDTYEVDSWMIFLMLTGFLFGFGAHMTIEGSQQYSQYCAKQMNASTKYSKYNTSMVQLFSVISLALSGWYFYDYFIDTSYFQQYAFFASLFSMLGLGLAIILPRPYSKTVDTGNKVFGLRTYGPEKYEEIKLQDGKCCKYISKLVSHIFSFRMLKHLLLITFVSSITAVFECLSLFFLFFNASDKLTKPPVAIAFFVLIPYYFVQLVFSLCECRRCYDTYDHGYRPSRVCGSLVNFFILGISLALIICGAIADNERSYYPQWPGFLKNFYLYVIVSFIIGIAQLIMQKQRRSLSLQYKYDHLFYQATQIVEEFLIILYQVFLFVILYENNYTMDDMRALVFWVLMPFQFAGTLILGIFLQILICLCFN